MADPKSIVGLLQLAMKAGRYVRGDGLIPAIQSNKAKLVVYDSEMGANRKKKLNDKCRSYQVPILEMNHDEFDSISTKAMKALAITDPGFAKAMIRKAGLDENTRSEICD